ncbi:GNAT family N-acetyltransferase [Myroides sp.]|uniref:GNAT family N-acetyltransferase n=1 Tax=Myroides sp. TaxID=1874736 RepID=UPI003F2F3735
MSGFSEEVHTYWQSQMVQGSIIHLDEVFTLVSNPSLKEMYKVMILEMTNKHTMAVATPCVVEDLKLKELEEYTVEVFREAISSCKIELHTPDYIYYLPNNRIIPAKPIQDSITFRPLSEENDVEVFRAFEANCSEEDLDGAYVSLKHWVVYGAFDGEELIGVSSAYLWNGTRLADLGVIIGEDYRDRSIATRLVQAICMDIIDKDYVPQYRCQTDNTASVALAEAVGFSLFGEWEVILAKE